MTQLAQRLGFDLTDTLTGDVELLAHFLEGVVSVHVDTEAHTQHLGFASGQAGADHQTIEWIVFGSAVENFGDALFDNCAAVERLLSR